MYLLGLLTAAKSSEAFECTHVLEKLFNLWKVTY